MLKAVIFDLDGVIADSHPLHHAAWKTLLAEQGRTVNDTEMDFILAGRQRGEILRHYLGELPEEQIAQLGKRKDELYQGRAHLLAPMPGLNTFLDELETAGIAKAVATSAGPARTLQTLKAFGMEQRFPVVLSSADAKAKPDPEIFLLAASKLKVNTNEALVIEDSVAGIQAAKAAGMKCIGYTSVDRFQNLRQAGADEAISVFIPGLTKRLQQMFADADRPASATSSS
jgi:HAD superfamily hydrolase (TIGR01509 family)